MESDAPNGIIIVLAPPPGPFGEETIAAEHPPDEVAGRCRQSRQKCVVKSVTVTIVDFVPVNALLKSSPFR